jgi:chitodextrinase
MKIKNIFLILWFFLSATTGFAQIDHWETVVNEYNTWEYLVPSAEPPGTWKTDLTTIGWATGTGGFGYDDKDDGSISPDSYKQWSLGVADDYETYGTTDPDVPSGTLSVFTRIVFNITDINAIDAAVFHMDYDDAYVAYLNGTELNRSANLVTTDPLPFDTKAKTTIRAVLYEGGIPQDVTVPIGLLNQGLNVLSIQAHNVSTSSSDLTSRGYLSLGINNTSSDYQPIPPWFNPPIANLGPPDGATDVGTDPTLSVYIEDPTATSQTVKFYGRVASTATAGPDFTLIALPDTQYYTEDGFDNGTASNTGSGIKEDYWDQMTWIAANRADSNIVYLAGLGDCVNNGDDRQVEWDNVETGIFSIEDAGITGLTEGIPYALNVGNHDQDPWDNVDGTSTTTFFNQYLGISRFTGRGYYGGNFDGTDNNNSYTLFSGGTGLDFIVINLEYVDNLATIDPAILAWVDDLLANQYPNRRAIIVSHSIVRGNGDFSDMGQDVYDTVKKYPNVFMMLNGHSPGEFKRTDVFNGNTITSMLTDYQNRTYGGDGFFRILRFSPKDNTVYATTYSTRTNAFEDDPDSEFSFPYIMDDFTLLSTQELTTETTTSLIWPSLATGTDYQWYVTVTNNTTGLTTKSDTWSFTTNGTPPTGITAPVAVDAFYSEPASIELFWQDMSGDESGFDIFRAVNDSTGTLTFVGSVGEDKVYFSDTTTLAGNTYYYRVRAVNAGAISDYAIFVGVTTPPDNTPPTAPQNLRIVGRNKIDQIILEWDPAIDDNQVLKYIVDYGTGIVEVNDPATSITLTGLAANSEYVITVTAEDLNGNRSVPSNQLTTTTYVTWLTYDHGSYGGATVNKTLSKEDLTIWPHEYDGYADDFSLEPVGSLVSPDMTNLFYFKWDGFISVPVDGDYTFYLSADDGAALYINPTDNATPYRQSTTEALVDADDLDAPITADSSAVITLTAGYHPISVTYREKTGGDSLIVEYSGPTGSGIGKQDVPSSALISGTYTPPTPPADPTLDLINNLSMQGMDLNWTADGTSNYEIYRSLATSGTPGPYSIIDTTGVLLSGATIYSVTGLDPGTEYFYYLKAISNNAASNPSNTLSATTTSDTQLPSTPTNLVEQTKTFTNVGLSWDASTDNIQVAGYEVYMDNVLIGTTATISFAVADLTPGVTYVFKVRAYDSSGNFSSSFSNTATVTTNSTTDYYSKATGLLDDVITWGDQTDGSGTNPADFGNGNKFYVSNGNTDGTGGAWNVTGSLSRIIVEDGELLTATGDLSGNLEVRGAGSVTLGADIVPQIISLSSGSTITFNGPNVSIPDATYGNLSLGGTGTTKNFSAVEISVAGNLTIADGVVLNGATGNQSAIAVQGNITFSGTNAPAAPNNRVGLRFNGGSAQTLSTSTNLDLFKITNDNSAGVNLAGTAITLSLGSVNGGGLQLNNGIFSLGSNTLALTGEATVNPNNTTGKLGIAGGSINMTSASGSNSNLYMNPAANTVTALSTNLTGTGVLNIGDTLQVTDGIKILAGTLNSAGFIKLISDATGTANIKQIEGGGAIIGAVNVQRFVPSNGKVWRYLATPVDTTTVGGWQQYISITGNFAESDPAFPDSNPSLYYYDEPNGGWIAYPDQANGESAASPIEAGRGYSVWLRDGDLPFTITNTGVPTQGDFTFTLTPGTTGNSNDGWNLVGNPFASDIEWSTNTTDWPVLTDVGDIIYVTSNSTSTSSGFYIWDRTRDISTGTNVLGELENGKIPAGQAFWVQTVESPSLTVSESAKTTDNSGQNTEFYRTASETAVLNNTFNVKMTDGVKEDVAYIKFTNYGIDGYYKLHDGAKRKNSFFNLSSESADGVALVVNNMSHEFCQSVIDLQIDNVATGSYTLNFEAIDDFAIAKVLLQDQYLNQTVAVSSDAVDYPFAVVAEDSTTFFNRFSLRIDRPELVLDQVMTNIAGQCAESDAVINVPSSQPGVVYHAVNADGEVISDEFYGDGGEVQLILPHDQLSSGSNTIKVAAFFPGCTVNYLDQEVIVDVLEVIPMAVIENDYITTCGETEISLTASGAPADGSYQWYYVGQTERPITDATSSSFMIMDVREYARYAVAVVSANGCESARQYIEVIGEAVERPNFREENGVLITGDYGFNIRWLLDGEPIFNATQPTYEPQQSGYYAVEYSSLSGGCSKVSPAREFEYDGENLVTGISPEEQFAAPYFDIFPNPTSATLNLIGRSDTNTDVTFRIVDLRGRVKMDKVFRYSEFSSGVNIDLDRNIAEGLYLVLVEQNGHIMQKKLFIE